MIMIRAIIRPEKTDEVLAALMDAGFPAVTKMDVYGRGKQRGMKIGEVTYDELPKELIFTVVRERRQGLRREGHHAGRPHRQERRIRRRQDLRLPGGRGLHRQFGVEGGRVPSFEPRYRRGTGMSRLESTHKEPQQVKEVLAIIRMNKMNETKQALVDAGVASFTARKVVGRGKGKVDFRLLQGAAAGHEEAISQLSPGPKLVPKRMLTIVVPDKVVPTIVKTIISVNSTGNAGDGKIFVLPVREAVRVRTGERDDAALDETID